MKRFLGSAAIAAGMSVTGATAGDTGTLVLGVLPYDSTVTVSLGHLDGEVFVADGKGKSYSNKDGYILVKVPDGKTAAITAVSVYGQAHVEAGQSATDYALDHYFDIFKGNAPGYAQQAFSRCDAGPTLSLAVPPGAVLFGATVVMALDEKKPAAERLQLHYSPQIDAARAHLKAEEPDMADRLQQGAYDLRVAKNCS